VIYLTVIYTDFALCTFQLKQESDTARKRLKALKINTTGIFKYLFNVNGSVKHIWFCSCSSSFLIFIQRFSTIVLPYQCNHLLSRSRSSDVLTLEIYIHLCKDVCLLLERRKSWNFFYILLNRVMLLNGNTFSRFLFNTNHQNDCNNQVIWIQLCNWLQIINSNTRSQTF
jgi:hypothetical protein